MKIVIDIDDNLYTRLFDNGMDNYDDAVDIAKSIRKGKQLPKGHGRLIDADKLRLHEKDVQQGNVTWLMDVYTKAEIEDAPTVIEADKENTDGSDNN